MEKRINECSYDDPNITPQDKEVIRQLAMLKHRDIIKDSINEYE